MLRPKTAPVAVLCLLFAIVAVAQSGGSNSDPLVQLLVSKGVLTAADAASLNAATSPDDQRRLLVSVLRQKGLISQSEQDMILGVKAKNEPILVATTSPKAITVPISQSVSARVSTPPAGPGVVAAVAPLRLLPVDPVKREGLIPDIKLGSGARVKPYGFVKASAIYDTSSPSGTDMPLPYLNGDTGPGYSPEFHVRARNMRIGAQFEWLDFSPKWAITGRFEADFEGSFTRALNRNISSVRSSQFSLRTAWGRLDRLVNDKNSWFVLFGQDWTPFGSSTIPNLVETTGLGLGYGTLYERLPQVRTGWIHTVGGSRQLKFLPEFAITMPAFGNTPTNISDQLGYGERQGADSGRPEVQGRFVTQWQFDKAPAVAPAQFIVSFVQATRSALVKASDVPTAFKSAFPGGGEVRSNRYGYTIELQLPTRALTFQAKYFNGQDLRFYFVGGLYSNYNDTAGLTGVTTAPSIDGASTVAFGLLNGAPVIAPQRPVRTQGVNTDIGLPISRWFGVNPASRAAGWSANLHYSADHVPAREARRMSGVRAMSDFTAFTLNYKVNALVTWQFEQSLYRTLAANKATNTQGGMFTLRGVPAREWHDLRTELGMLFTF
ncbi:MAG: hypothetical protein JSU00_23090 [Acidobacteria bacterium]|nr:hypothetical protein [Acidobacteriota bacterium]